MKTYRYVRLDPTGNLTCLVLDPADPADEAAVTKKLLSQCEQVAYLVPPTRPEAAAGIRLMGGEFCGNAAMAAAAWLVRDELRAGEEKTFLLEVSGAQNPVECTVRGTEAGFTGTVNIPGIPESGEECFFGIPFTAVRMEGIVHLICDDRALQRDEAESLLKKIAEQLPDQAIGLLQWDREEQYLIPLVFVRDSRSLVWEHGCGSGSAAVGAYEAIRNGGEKTTVSVRQPGGTIRVTVTAEKGKISSITITGQVRMEGEKEISI